MMAVGIGDILDVVGKIQLCQTTPETAAIKVSQHRGDALIPRSMYQSGGCIEHWLKSMELGRRKSDERCVAVVVTWHNQRHDRRMEHKSRTLNV